MTIQLYALQEQVRYTSQLAEARHYATIKGVINGTCFSCNILAIYCTFALTFWYGTQLFIHDDYSPGKIFVVSVFDTYSSALSSCYGYELVCTGVVPVCNEKINTT